MDVGSERLKVVYSTDCIRYPLTGIGRYAYELAKELQRPERNLELLFLHGLKIGHLLTEPAESTPSAQSLKRHLKNSKLVSDIYRLTIPTMKSFLLKKREDAVFHSPNYYIPSGVRRSIATFHDLSVFHLP
ncbi:MAG: mannosyltransferase, partial [Neobacillus sp.]|nr:mannosyltransferase [Neobacillus sp.]